MIKIKPDKWQKEFLKTLGNKVLRSGRQVGKSTIVAIGAGEYAVKHKNKTILVVAATERQAYLLFEKVLSHIYINHKKMICKGKDRPTKSKLMLTNGSTIHCLPTGESGYGIRGYTVDLLIADEAAYIKEAVWDAVTPMMATTKGEQWLLSTPYGKKGYFYDCFNDPSFSSFHISSEDCPRVDKDYLALEKQRKTKLGYAQEYLGQFVDELRQFFPSELIEKTCILQRERDSFSPHKRYYLGVDIARMGTDESTFEIIDRTDKKNLRHVENIMTRKTLTTESTRKILQLEDKYKFKQIFIDDGGMGVGVFDQLLEDERTRRKVVAINNEARPLTRDEKKIKKALKEDIFNNLLMLMERKMIKLLNDDEVKLSLKSIQYEYMPNGKIKIYGSYAHIADGLVRAAWCYKDKSLNIWIR